MQEDLILWRKLKEGDENAFQQIYSRHIRQLSLYCRRFTVDQEMIEDALHDIFVQLWTRRDALGDTDSIIKYLTVTVRREMVRRVQQSYKYTGFENAENVDLDFTMSAEDAIIFSELSEENKRKLSAAMDLLSARQKEALYLRYFEECSYDEICEAMDINYQSVRNLISRAIMDMRKFLIVLTLLIFSYFF